MIGAQEHLTVLGRRTFLLLSQQECMISCFLISLLNYGALE
jgi:hypothetical protein